jgi:hypothetical protein
MTIYATRGDVVYFPVEKKVGDSKYLFQPGDIVRIRVCEKKNYSKVFLLKDFEVEEATTSVNIFLDKWAMKFGPIINKPTDYWYEVELNPDTYPDTIIGHNENGPAVFKLFPEAKDVVDGEIPDPEENGAVSRMVVHFVSEYLGGNAEGIIIQEITKPEYVDMVIQEIIKDKHIDSIVQEIIKEESFETIIKETVKEEHTETIVQEIIKPGNVETIIQEIVKEEHVETIVQEILQPEHTETIIQEIIKPGNVETIVQEIVKEEHVETIVQEILQPENTHTIVQEVLKPENTTIIVEQVMEEIPGNITVEVDTDTMTANYTNTQIIEHLENGGTARVKVSSSGAYFQLYGIVGTTVMFGAPAVNEAEQVELVIYSIWASGSVSKDVFTMGGSGGTGKPFKDIEVTENADGSVTIENTFTDGTYETITLAAGEKPDSVTYNGVAIPIKWVVGA